MAESIRENPVQTAQKFGTFLGVFTPSVLTILGLIMYLRFGWVVGNVGLPITLLIVLVSSSITFITGLSASAISTNMNVGVGGEYFMISRSLGLELGGAIGIPLFLCRTLSITFYSFGLAESLILFLPATWGTPNQGTIQILTAIIIIIITAVAGKSASLTLKLQIPIMAAVALSILALVIGVTSSGFHSPELVPTYRTAPEGFWYVFAVFFPAVTGFTAGIGMSGDLRDPRKSIPRGTLLAIATGTITYIFILVLMAISAQLSYEEMAQPGVVWTKLAIFGPWLVFPGLWGAILSSAFGSVLGGPRVLQALASDGLAPKFLAKLSKTGQPTTATWVSGIIALGAVALGGLNSVAQFVTILFLTLYVMINLSAAIEKLVGDPSYRPTISIPWMISLLGSVGAIIVMFLISPQACFAAIILEVLLYLYLHRRSMKKQWGDVRAGLWVALARFALLKLRNHEMDPRNWRPHILVFAGDTAKRIGLVRLATWFNQNRGLVTVCQLIVGDLKHEKIDTEQKRHQMDRNLEKEGLVGFCNLNVVSEYESGAINIAQAKGIGGLQSNTMLFGWPQKKDRLESILRIMRAVSSVNKNTIIARLKWSHEPGQEKRIDLWWGGLQNNGDLMFLLAYLLRLNPEWKGSKITVRSIVETEAEKEKMSKNLTALIPQARIHAETQVIVKPENLTVAQTMQKYSGTSDVVMLGLNVPEGGGEREYAERLTEISDGFNTTIFVRNAGKFSGNLI